MYLRPLRGRVERGSARVSARRLGIMSFFCACARVCKCEVLRRMLLRPRSAKVSTSPGSQRGPDARCMLYSRLCSRLYAECCMLSDQLLSHRAHIAAGSLWTRAQKRCEPYDFTGGTQMCQPGAWTHRSWSEAAMACPQSSMSTCNDVTSPYGRQQASMALSAQSDAMRCTDSLQILRH